MTAEEEKIVRERDDVKFLLRPQIWPCWPVCPVKRYVDRDQVCGLVFDSCEPDRKVWKVVRLNMFHPWTPEEFTKAEKWEYNSVEELVADGWMVD